MSASTMEQTDAETVECDDCSNVVEKGDLHTVDRGYRIVCDDCEGNYGSCEDCEQSVHMDNLAEVTVHSSYRSRTKYVCNFCRDTNYVSCDRCSEYGESDSSYEDLHGNDICNWCRENYYSYCDDCDGYYDGELADEHEHGGCDCEASAQDFSIRNDGDGPLKNDTRVTVTLPAGVIDSQGLSRIRSYIREEGRASYTYDGNGNYIEVPARYPDLWRAASLDVGPEWQKREGNFTKRLSREAHKQLGIKIPAEVLSHIGNIAREHSSSTNAFNLEVTRNLNLSAEDFGHADSCWWQSYSESRCALKSNGGFGLRTFNTWGGVSGRAWVMPLKDIDGHLRPTFDTETPDAFIVFNGYGELSGYMPARLMGHMAGMTYRKVDFEASPMYINAGGYLVAPEDIAGRYTDGGVSLYLDMHSNLYHSEQQELTSNVA